jgi:hypothetical protein
MAVKAGHDLIDVVAPALLGSEEKAMARPTMTVRRDLFMIAPSILLGEEVATKKAPLSAAGPVGHRDALCNRDADSLHKAPPA